MQKKWKLIWEYGDTEEILSCFILVLLIAHSLFNTSTFK